MRLLLSALLGMLQGLTEFLPVSSSGHLVVLHAFADPLPGPERLAFDVLLHGGTLAALLVFFRKEIVALCRSISRLREASAERSMILAIVIGSVPTAVIGLLLRGSVEDAGVVLAGSLLIVTGVLLALTAFARKGTRELGWKTALVVGAVQGLAVLPGISRSGATIAAGLFCGLSDDEAFRFSFLLLIPAQIGALVIEAAEIGSLPPAEALIGFAAALALGLLALRLLAVVMRRGRLHWFAAYCIPAGGAALAAGWTLGG